MSDGEKNFWQGMAIFLGEIGAFGPPKVSKPPKVIDIDPEPRYYERRAITHGSDGSPLTNPNGLANLQTGLSSICSRPVVYGKAATESAQGNVVSSIGAALVPGAVGILLLAGVTYILGWWSFGVCLPVGGGMQLCL